MIIRCDCQDEFQDKKYGKYNRVFNPVMKTGQYRCTICEKVKTDSGEKVDSKKAKKVAKEK